MERALARARSLHTALTSVFLPLHAQFWRVQPFLPRIDLIVPYTGSIDSAIRCVKTVTNTFDPALSMHLLLAACRCHLSSP